MEKSMRVLLLLVYLKKVSVSFITRPHALEKMVSKNQRHSPIEKTFSVAFRSKRKKKSIF